MGCGSTHHAKLLPPLDHTAACAKVASCRQGRLSTAQPLQAACAYLVDLAQPGVDGREDVLWGAHAHEHVVMAVAIVTPLLFRDISKMRQAGVHAEQQATFEPILGCTSRHWVAVVGLLSTPPGSTSASRSTSPTWEDDTLPRRP